MAKQIKPNLHTSRIIKSTILLLGLVISPLSFAAKYDYQKTQKLQLASEQLEELELDVGAGFVKIEGNANITQIEVSAELDVDQDNYLLTLEKRGNSAFLQADANVNNRNNWFGDSPKIDLTIQMPANMNLTIKDGSGFIEVSSINGKLVINDGSGGIVLNKIHNSIKIDDGSGEIDVSDAQGEITIDDGSGSITLTDVKGAVKIVDGSGSITVSKIVGNMDIRDGSGNLTATDIDGEMKIDDGSGGINLDRISGHVTIDDGSGGISVNNLESGLTILSAGSGGLSIKNVKGKVISD